MRLGALILLLAASGCVQTSFTSGNVHVKRTQFLTKVSLGTVQIGTNGVITIRSYANDQSEAAAAVASAVAEGVVRGVK
jgi:hypothetical protein